MQSRESILELLLCIDVPERLFPGGAFEVHEKGDGFLVQLIFYAEDADDPEVSEVQRCRKWYVSSHCTDTEVIRTAYKACEAAVLHELDELFLFKGARIYNPHYDAEALVKMAEEAQVDIRPPMKEDDGPVEKE